MVKRRPGRPLKVSRKMSDSEESPKAVAKHLEKNLRNTERELEIHKQITSQLEVIHKTSNVIQEVSDQLLDDKNELSATQALKLKTKLSKAKRDLKGYEERLLLLKDFESNDFAVAVNRLDARRTSNNTFIINNKQVLVEGMEYVLSGSEADSGSDVSTASSEALTNTSDNLDRMSKTIRVPNRARSPRKEPERVVPERFESFPNNGPKRLNVSETYGLTDTETDATEVDSD